MRIVLLIGIIIMLSCTHKQPSRGEMSKINQDIAYLGNGDYRLRTYFDFQQHIPPYKIYLYDSSIFGRFEYIKLYKHHEYAYAKKHLDSSIKIDYIPFDSIELLKRY